MSDVYDDNKPPRMVSSATMVAEKKKYIFLTVLAKTGRVKKAAQAAGYADTTVMNQLRKKDPEFAAAWDAAIEASNDVLEDEAIRRAVDGVEKPITYRGEITGYEKVYSDGLLTTLLKANNRKKFGDQQEVRGVIEHHVGVAVIPSTNSNELDWERQSEQVHANQKSVVIDVNKEGKK